MMISRRSALLGLGAGIMSTAALASPIEVDTALVLLQDVSSSINDERFGLQSEGIAAAFASPEFHQALSQTAIGKIAVAYVQWAQGVHVASPTWTLIDSVDAAMRFAKHVRGINRMVAGGTGVLGALREAQKLLADCPYEPLRRVIDISSDGQEWLFGLGDMDEITRDAHAMDVPTQQLRDQILGMPGAPVTINAITMIGDEPDVTDWYQRNVIGGPGHFILEAKQPAEFPALFKRKILTEAV